MPKFNRTADVEFAINGTDQRVTVSNLPYCWDSDKTPHMDEDCVFDAIAFLRGTGMTQGLDLICVSTSRA